MLLSIGDAAKPSIIPTFRLVFATKFVLPVLLCQRGPTAATPNARKRAAATPPHAGPKEEEEEEEEEEQPPQSREDAAMK